MKTVSQLLEKSSGEAKNKKQPKPEEKAAPGKSTQHINDPLPANGQGAQGQANIPATGDVDPNQPHDVHIQKKTVDGMEIILGKQVGDQLQIKKKWIIKDTVQPGSEDKSMKEKPSKNESIEEMVMNTAKGGKLVWKSHGANKHGIMQHEVELNGEPQHTGMINARDASRLYQHLAAGKDRKDMKVTPLHGGPSESVIDEDPFARAKEAAKDRVSKRHDPANAKRYSQEKENTFDDDKMTIGGDHIEHEGGVDSRDTGKKSKKFDDSLLRTQAEKDAVKAQPTDGTHGGTRRDRTLKQTGALKVHRIGEGVDYVTYKDGVTYIFEIYGVGGEIIESGKSPTISGCIALAERTIKSAIADIEAEIQTESWQADYAKKLAAKKFGKSTSPIKGYNPDKSDHDPLATKTKKK